MTSRAPELLEYLSTHPEITVDVGQVMFGPALTMTADAHVSALLRDLTHGKWINHDTEVETGCGIVPYIYRAGNYVHALQWGIGLELFLLGKDPWQVMLSTDHPNGGSFLSYPKLIRLLMDRGFREDQMRRANQRAIRRTALPDGLDREYTLNEIAIITRAAPARRLGLRDKGHLRLARPGSARPEIEAGAESTWFPAARASRSATTRFTPATLKDQLATASPWPPGLASAATRGPSASPCRGAVAARRWASPTTPRGSSSAADCRPTLSWGSTAASRTGTNARRARIGSACCCAS